MLYISGDEKNSWTPWEYSGNILVTMEAICTGVE